ncbi:cupin domain-containing protein [Streptomyces niveus]|uniref:cupin domain-containing protein n=1 Tax=Streptomyces niveus TaxID=193462 RepID=UPI0036AD6867
MSYPEPRHHGDKGEANAVYRPASTPADVRSPAGAETHFVASSVSTGGEFGLYRMDMVPRGGGPSTHFHKTISESFYILEGTVRLYDGERWIDAEKGDFLYVPGAPREEYFEKVSTVGRMTDEERTAFFIKHDTYWVD